MKCESCNNEHDGTFATGRFCSRTCANKHRYSPEKKDEIYQRVSQSLTGIPTGPRKWSESARLAFKVRHEQRAAERANGPWEMLPKHLWKARILKEQGELCAICSLPQVWNEKPLIFHVDHINGKKQDQRRENLRAICPNCHSQTPTYGHRNVSEEGKKRIIMGCKNSNGGKGRG